MTCKECKYGKQFQYGINCRLKDRYLVTDRAESCKNYELKTEVKKYKERMKVRN